ncbi:MAG: orotidine-5'-phosphate decarboxylase [Elusimicrobiota bacterium]|nr:orotidine-5'-phosphate decarboxylase [Endomicrobiia bacterium]MDW8166249.1 orotidine-5'-phosphate decarboxylase [Elusimicrobiota bacterium]
MNSLTYKSPKLVIALDTELEKAKKIIDVALKFNFDIFKIGHLLFDVHPEIINYINKNGGKVLLDLKFHDIPTVISKALKAILKKYKIWGFTLHTLGGQDMLKEVKKTIQNTDPKPIIFAVTILTSLAEKDLKVFKFKTNLKNTVLNLAKLAKNAGADGVVCSVKELEIIKKICGKNFLTLVPGININNQNPDQKRTDTIEKAISLGADYIVVGRSIYEEKNFQEKFEYIKKILNYPL